MVWVSYKFRTVKMEEWKEWGSVREKGDVRVNKVKSGNS